MTATRLARQTGNPCQLLVPLVPLALLVHVGRMVLMEITIDIESSQPPFEQLIDQIKAAVTAGVLKPGKPLPSIRQLAGDLDLNTKTVAKAYKLLERDSIIETKGYRGTFIHPDAKTNCKFDIQEWTARKLREAIDELREAGVTDSEIRNAFSGALGRRTPQ